MAQTLESMHAYDIISTLSILSKRAYYKEQRGYITRTQGYIHGLFAVCSSYVHVVHVLFTFCSHKFTLCSRFVLLAVITGTNPEHKRLTPPEENPHASYIYISRLKYIEQK